MPYPYYPYYQVRVYAETVQSHGYQFILLENVGIYTTFSLAQEAVESCLHFYLHHPSEGKNEGRNKEKRSLFYLIDNVPINLDFRMKLAHECWITWNGREFLHVQGDISTSLKEIHGLTLMDRLMDSQLVVKEEIHSPPTYQREKLQYYFTSFLPSVP